MPAGNIPVSGFPLSAVTASSGLGSQPSGIGHGLSGTGTGAGPEPVPGAEYLNLRPEGRDLGPGMNHTRSKHYGFRFPLEWVAASSGHRSQPSGIRYGLSGTGTGAGPNLNLVLNTRTRDLMAET